MFLRKLAVASLALMVGGCGAPLGPELFVHGAPLHRADAIVVLGNRPPRSPNGGVAPETRRRVQRGVELFARGLAPVLVMAGGPAPGGGTEAQVMSAYARSLGVPTRAIREERRSRDTAENATNTVALLCAERQGCHPQVIVVSSPYHLRRAGRLFACAGADVQVAATRIPADTGYQIGFTAYEYGVGIAYGFADPCARLSR